MARTLDQIRDAIRADFVANPVIIAAYTLDVNKTFAQQFSKVSIESVFIDVITLSIWASENIFDIHRREVDETIRLLKPHTLRWYRQKALLFRLGHNLINDTDQYSDVGLLASDIENAQVVKYAAAIESQDGSGTPVLRIKIAGTQNNDLIELPQTTVDAVKGYFDEIKDAGVKLLVTSNVADNFSATLEIYYNTLVLDSTGKLLTGGNIEPVRVAVNEYLKSLPFNGEFTIMSLTDAIQHAEGVEIVQVLLSQSHYGNLAYQNTGTRYIPDAGYMRVYNTSDLTINYIPYRPNE